MRRIARILALAVVTGAATASAQPAGDAAGPSAPDRQLAQSLFDRGRELMEQRDFEHACPLLAESQRLDPSAGTLLNLAVCHEGEERLATAHFEFNEALSQAIRDNRKDRQDIARERIAAIAPRLSRIAVDVRAEADVAGLRVQLDGRAVSRAAWGVLAAVDGGPHRIDATAPGRRPWSTTVTVRPAEDLQRVRVPVLAPEGSAPTARAATCPAGTRWIGGACRAESRGTSAQTYIGVGLAVTGGVSLLVGAVSGYLAIFQSIELDVECSESNLCGREHRDDVDAYETTTTISTVGFIAGGALIVGGIVLLATAPPRRSGSLPRPGGLRVAVGPFGASGTFD